MVGLDSCVVVLKYNFQKVLVCGVNDRCSDHWWSINWHCREVECVDILLVIEICQPQRSIRWGIRDTTQCSPFLPIDDNRWFIPQLVNLAHIERAIVK